MKPNSLPKSMMVSGRLAVSALLEKGKGGVSGCLRYKWVAREDCHFDQTQCVEKSRILVSVPKKLFHRAVKRNLLKRRMREAFRVQQGLIGPRLDILFVYISKAVLPFETIYADMTAALTTIAGSQAPSSEAAPCHFEPVEKSHE
jgi:ribonuclease P protein component